MSDVATRAGKTAADRLMIKVAVSRGHRGKVTNVVKSWPDFINTISTPFTDNITWKQYEKLSVTEQIKLKNKGYFVGGHFEGGKRKRENITERSMLTLDVDRSSLDQFEELCGPIASFLTEYEYFLYTTRSHKADKPRYRLLLPLYAAVGIEAFMAASRILAQKLDPSMNLVDPVSFRQAQVMYNPSICKDGDFYCYRHQGRLLDANTDLLDTFEGDWRNHRELPRGDRDNVRQTAAKAEHPAEKRGVVGAYCRARDVFAQMALMPDLYEPSEEGPTPIRWSYIKGSMRDGVMLFPEDWRIQSWHSTDPAADKNLTTFDMQRIQRFGHLDQADDEYEDVKPSERPSYKALVKAIQDEPEYEDVRHEYAAMNYDQDAMADDAEFDADLEDDDEPATTVVGAVTTEALAVVAAKPKSRTEVTSDNEEQEQVDLLDLLDLTEKGGVRKTLYNIELILKHDRRFKEAFRFNEFLSKTVVVRPISSKALKQRTPAIKHKGNGDPLTDNITTTARIILSAPNRPMGDSKAAVGWGLQASDEETTKAIHNIAITNRFHPVKKYLKAIKWDGTSRIDTMFHRYWHTPDDVYHAEVARVLLIGAIARIYEPGAKFDYMVIIEGLQNCGKSSSIAILAVFREWFAEFMADVSKNDKVIEAIAGRWIIEWPELSSMNKAESETLKAIISAGGLGARLAYAKNSDDYPMQGVFMGTTNNKKYLKDPTGNRRYLPIAVPEGKRVDLPLLRQDVHQLWAEAHEVYLWMRRCQPKGELQIILNPEAQRQAEIKQGARMVEGIEDYWHSQIEEFLITPQPIPVARGENTLVSGEADDGSTAMLLPTKLCVMSVAKHVLGLDKRFLSKLDTDKISRALDKCEDLERTKYPVRFAGFGKHWAWVLKDL